MNKNTPTIVMLSLIGITMLSGIILTSSKVSADNDSVTDEVNITVPVACTMGGSIATGNEHTATLLPGTYSGTSGSGYENGIGKTTLTTYCNDYNGFSIYAIGYTNDTDGDNTMLGTSASGNATIPTKVYESTDTTSNWSMKVNKITDSTISYNPNSMTIQDSFDSWHAVPSEYAKVAEYKASTGSSATDTTLGAKVETTYAAYISSTQPADTYTGKVKYTMVHPYDAPEPFMPHEEAANSGKICYYPNTDDHEGTMGCQDIPPAKDWSSCVLTDYSTYCIDNNYKDVFDSLPNTNEITVTLLASNYSREGYGFAGWTDRYDYDTNLGRTNIRFYGPQESVTLAAGQYSSPSNGLSLYAVWVKSEGSIQDASKVASVCNRLTAAPSDGSAGLSSVSALTDQRDNNTYAIAKLADGNCWMIENLRLEAGDTRGQNRFDGSVSNASLAQDYGTSAIYGNFVGLADSEDTNYATTVANSLYYSGTQSGTASIDIGTSDEPVYRMPRYNNFNTSTRASNPTDNSANMYSYGNYYTWHAAIADLAYYDGINNRIATNTSLCPAGWRLPLGDTSTGDIGEGVNDVANKVPGFSYLDRKLGGNGASQSVAEVSLRWRKYPNNFLYSGYFDYSSSVSSRGGRGYYWSSTAFDEATAYRFDLNGRGGNSIMGLGEEHYVKYLGHSIRCVATL